MAQGGEEQTWAEPRTAEARGDLVSREHADEMGCRWFIAWGGQSKAGDFWYVCRRVVGATSQQYGPLSWVTAVVLKPALNDAAAKEAALRDAVDLLDDFAKAARLICDPVERVEKRAAGYSAGDWAASTLDPLLARRAALSKTGEGA